MKDLINVLRTTDPHIDAGTAGLAMLKAADALSATPPAGWVACGERLPDGWVAVPREPTLEMRAAFWRQYNGTPQSWPNGDRDAFSNGYRAMLAALPPGTAQPSGVAGEQTNSDAHK